MKEEAEEGEAASGVSEEAGVALIAEDSEVAEEIAGDSEAVVGTVEATAQGKWMEGGLFFFLSLFCEIKIISMMNLLYVWLSQCCSVQ